MSGVFARLVRSIALVVSLIASAAGAGEASPAGLIITNTVTAQYSDPRGLTYGAQSNTIAVSIAAVAAIVVSPKEAAVDPAAEGYPVGTPVARTFTITNAGNVADAYTIQALTAGAGTITSIALLTAAGPLPVTVGTTVSPALQPGESVKVQVAIATTGVGVGAAFPITLTARSTNASVANGIVTDSGKGWAVAQPGASIAGPGGPATSVTKLVNAVRSHAANPGETVTYSIAFKNYGGSPATNVVLVDDCPAGIVPLAQTVALNGVNVASSATLAGQRLSVRIGTLAVGASGTVTFDAVVRSGSTAGASYVNVATLSADAIAPIATTPASVLVGLANIVYDGFAGSGSPVNGAVLTLRDFNTKAILALPRAGGVQGSAVRRSPLDELVGIPAGGLPPNTTNANPYTTASDGAYSFVFAAGQLGTAAQPAQYELDIVAPGFRNRRIAVSISPDPSGLLYDATLRELDDQMLASPGGFTL
ncbi:MAG: conserved repeat domain protein, partial [Candidatus Eremiobacteraeota bacterium]|nr:conserved repeat domain protein [Candidatus Eremiobacteraeota bacterium]